MAGILKPKVFACLSCGASLEITALGYSNTIVCQKCMASIDISLPLPVLIKKYKSLVHTNPAIPLGSFGTLRGIKWKVIGFMVREDVEYKVSWNEYLLYNPYHGFRFLFEMDYHFSFVETLNFNPLPELNDEPTSVDYPKIGEFKIYNRGRAEVLYVIGEYYWRVKQGDQVKIDDYICPPYMLSVEKDSGEINYSLSEYLTYNEVVEAFKAVPDISLSPPWKSSPNAPNPYHNSFGPIMKTFWVSLFILALIAFFSGISKPESKIASFNLAQSDFSNAQKEFVSPSFDLPDSYGNVEIKLSSAVNNHWLSSDIVLVNEETGEEYKSETGVEYYSGYDDGYWSEGSQTSSEIISSIPGGHYHTEISAETDMGEKILSLDMRRNGSMMINSILTLIGLSLYPIWVYFRRRQFEVSRWENSDYSPYPTQDYSSVGDVISDALDGSSDD